MDVQSLPEVLAYSNKLGIVKTLVQVFESNALPMTITDLYHQYRVTRKKQVNYNDRTASLRGLLSSWNLLARRMKVGQHPLVEGGCTISTFHRVCKRREPKKGTVYWLSDSLRLLLYKCEPRSHDSYSWNKVPDTCFENTHVDTCFPDVTAWCFDTPSSSQFVLAQSSTIEPASLACLADVQVSNKQSQLQTSTSASCDFELDDPFKLIFESDWNTHVTISQDQQIWRTEHKENRFIQEQVFDSVVWSN